MAKRMNSKQYPERYWHCRVKRNSQDGSNSGAIVNDWSFKEIETKIVNPLIGNRRISIEGLIIKNMDDVLEIQIVQTDYQRKHYADVFNERNRRAGIIIIKDSRLLPFEASNGKDYTDELLFSNSQPDTKPSSKEKKMPNRNSKKVFVIHGRNEKARRAVFDFLRALHLEPLEWNHCITLTREPSPFIGKILDTAFEHAQGVIAIFTGDDEARLRAEFRDPGESEEALTPQARANVIFEAGMAMGRCPERTIIIEIGRIRDFSDKAGRNVVRMSNDAKRRIALVERLRITGCTVDNSGTDWLTAGDFDICTTHSR